jgi:hypothetical protein
MVRINPNWNIVAMYMMGDIAVGKQSLANSCPNPYRQFPKLMVWQLEDGGIT